MRHIVSTFVMAGLCLATVYGQEKAVETTAGKTAETATDSVKKKEEASNVQIAILLDTSSSMDGLINQARSQIWKIVNEMTLSKQNGKRPNMQIALYEYGNSRLKEKDGYIRKVLPFTDDLDAVSEALFKLDTCGGDEYCGAVIDKSTKDLDWNTADKNALKMVFIAGNEEFSQGKVKYSGAIKRALEKGITVNTIYCGGETDGDAREWKSASLIADGSYVSIDHNATPPVPEAPQDKALADLSVKLNGTYVAYGKKEEQLKMKGRQVTQDEKALEIAPSAVAERAVAKASKTAYKNTSWDMVDAFSVEGEVSEAAFKDLRAADSLPEELNGKSDEEIKKYVEGKAKEREDLQKQIKELSEQRQTWLDAKMKETATQPTTLDKAVIDSLRKQAEKKQFEFDKKPESK